MVEKLYKNMKNTKGFTLIEMLVVIAIIGLLSSVVLVALGPSRNKAKDARIISDINQTRVILETKFSPATGAYTYLVSDYGALTTDVSNNGGTLSVQPSAGAGSTYAISSALVSGGYYCVDSTGKVGAASAASSSCP